MIALGSERRPGDRLDIGYQALFVIPTTRTRDLSFCCRRTVPALFAVWLKRQKNGRGGMRGSDRDLVCPKRRTRDVQSRRGSTFGRYEKHVIACEHFNGVCH
jgi:hypothetical protein